MEEARERKPPVRVERPVTESEPRVPTEVREEVTTLEAKVVPVSEPAGAVPVILPVKLPVPLVKKRLVVEALVEKRLVVVAWEPVALVKVKSWRVEEPESRRLMSVVKPPVAVSVPVKLAAEEMV